MRTGGNTQEFRWDGGRRILLTFTGGAASGGSAPAGGGEAGSVTNLQDLVGARASSGETALRDRGYTWVRAEQSGDDSYAYWRENENGQCVVVRTSNGRYASIARGMDTSCKRGAASGGGSTDERQDPFDTVCGVIVDNQDYAYRCGATDFYSGGRKAPTELGYPDQVIQLTWHSDSRVSLQFEGMVAKDARYSTSEGETNWAFEGKTDYYFSDKGRPKVGVTELPRLTPTIRLTEPTRRHRGLPALAIRVGCGRSRPSPAALVASVTSVAAAADRALRSPLASA
jgi:hypothetical protein